LTTVTPQSSKSRSPGRSGQLVVLLGAQSLELRELHREAGAAEVLDRVGKLWTHHRGHQLVSPIDALGLTRGHVDHLW
jgi:hypothetical protein